MNRVPIPKRIRFEVLKRDKFRCQYCGRTAEEEGVVLHIDHITPVAKGGTNDITNLITACNECNLGKSDIELSDNVALMKKRAQLEQLEERREMLGMMHDWQLELAEEALSEAVIVSDVFNKCSGYALTDSGLKEACKLIKRFGLDVVCESVIKAASYYDDAEIAWSKVGGICWCSTHTTCYSCANYRGKTACGNVRCTYSSECGPISSVKQAEYCEMFESRESGGGA